MPFRTQRLVNKFPTWTKIRRDPSSFGARFFSVFADYFDFKDMQIKKMGDETNLLKYHMSVPWVWRFVLDEDDHMPVVIQTGGIPEWTYPTSVVGTHAIDGVKTLTRVESIEDLLWSVPDNLSVVSATTYTSNVIWDSDVPTVYNDMAYSDRLMVLVSGSTNFFRRSQFRNRSASGYHAVVIKGKDINGVDFTEYLFIDDDGRYLSRNIWKSIDSVDSDGFDGRIQIAYHHAPSGETLGLKDPYHLMAAEDATEGQLEMYFLNDILQYQIKRIKSGKNYRTGDPTIVDNMELVWEQSLADMAGTALSGLVSMDIHPDTGRLYVLRDDGWVFVYDHSPTTFSPPVDDSEQTVNKFVEVRPLRHWATLNEDMKLFTWLLKPGKAVTSVVIKRRDPGGGIEYLQSDKTWSTLPYTFPGADPTGILPEDTWKDFGFSSVFNQYGIWEFYCTTTTYKGDTSVDYTGVMVDKLIALAEFDSTVSTPLGIYFSENGLLVVMNGTEISHLAERSHRYFARERTQEIFLREEYSDIEVTS